MEIEKRNEYKNRWIILAVVVLLPFMATLDSTIVNVVLPVMVNMFSVTMYSIQLIIICYLITIVSTILFFGRLGDIKGKSIIFNLGLLVFTIGSLLCGLSKTFTSLVFFRIVQAIGASAAMANNQGIITQVFPANERGKALGISGTFIALGTMIGPPLGGFIVSYLNWNYIFFINVPIGIIATIVGFKMLPRKLNEKKEDIDFAGAIIFGVSVIFLFYALIVGQTIGYDNSKIIFSFFMAALLFAVFILVEKKQKYPLIDFSVFKNSLFSVGIVCTFICYASFNSNNIVQPFYLENVLKMTPDYAGMIMMICPVIITIIAPFSGHLSDKIGSESLTFIGLIVMGIGMGLMATLNESSPVQELIVYISLIGIGNGLFLSPNNSLVMSSAPSNKLGIAGSINAFVRNLGQSSGVAMATSLLYYFMSIKMGKKVLGYVEGRNDVFIFGMKYVYISAALICFIGVVTTVLRLKRKKHIRQNHLQI
ncbi:MFS transporter [Clostridium saccharobutylicum]|uniref:Transporter YebQ n=1 Tax=Clostridium saccharobutylicum DSM 13864 TaxID=1345695 RepID=U5MRP6_CLOSA|nr:MFS transporter [Clostridium saccharobutylicum]AGX43439.1 transporter YebQ [Clostridium saccharobutylicum DSM 13864]AQR90737.1 multidrug resistance protein Stp [Clostridium saccharobutylicum]AQS00641.1 multidrug resistance protein Stp [Clostridium saccharobutylicum]AQS14624.1 multidrug resistance protein Stp [Clostridium saccharobutylicum]MBA2907239.1 EmrB/QacA subfamily drug resistance transporter [Clostridium saccharobutylicum]